MKINKTICLLFGLCTFLLAFATESSAIQYARPDADIQTGNWTPSTGSNLFATVNEPAANDAPYMEATSDNDIAQLRLSSIDTPDLSSGGLQTISIRAKKSFWPRRSSGSIRVVLLSNGISVYDYTIDLTTSWTTQELTVTSTNFDYSALEIRLTSKGTTSAFDISWIEFKVPDAPTGVLIVANPTASAIGVTTATLGAEITALGATNVTERGCVWSTSPDPSNNPEGSWSESGSFGLGTFTCDATGLTLDTPYYFDGYAVDSDGTAYSGMGTFTTEDKPRMGHNYDVETSMIDCMVCHGLHTGLVPTGNDIFGACEKCHSIGNSAANMRNIDNHIVTKESESGSNPQPTYIIDCGKCHEMHKTRDDYTDPNDSLESDDTAHGGTVARNRSYVRVDMTEYAGTDEISTAKANTIFHSNNNGVPIPGDQPRTYSYGPELPDGPNANNGVCQSCHTDTKYHTNDGTGEDHKKEINCLNCHVHRDPAAATGTRSKAFEGRGHAPGDKNIGISANCSNTQGCHPTPRLDPVAEVHREKCYMCHTNPAGGGDLWEPWQSSYVSGNDCEDCHFTGATVAERADGHHTFSWSTTGSKPAGEEGQAQKGLCIDCHEPDVGQPGDTRADLAMPKNLPCNLCHVYWPNNGYTQNGNGQVEIYGLSFDPNGAEWGQRATAPLLTTHTISKATDPPISDYAACFACHGATSFTGSNGTAPQVVPFHGLGTPYSNTNDVAGNTSTGGDIDDLINAYSGDSNGNQTSGSGQPVHVFPFHPGFKALNWLANDVGWQAYRFYGFPRSNRRWHENDWNAGTHTRGNSTYGNGTSFEIPWDDYAASSPPSLPVQKDVNIGGRKGTQNVDVVIPTVPLTLP